MDFKETVHTHTLPKIRGIETDEITALSSQSAEQDQREKTNIIIINNKNNNNSSNQDIRERTTKTRRQHGCCPGDEPAGFAACEDVLCCRYSTSVRRTTGCIKPSESTASGTLSHQLNM